MKLEHVYACTHARLCCCLWRGKGSGWRERGIDGRMDECTRVRCSLLSPLLPDWVADWLSLCSVCWNDWVLACRKKAGQFYIHTYITAIVMPCVLHVHCVCLNMQIRSHNAFKCVCGTLRVCECECNCGTSSCHHSLTGCLSLRQGAGLRWPVLNIDSTMTTCPTWLIKPICTSHVMFHLCLGCLNVKQCQFLDNGSVTPQFCLVRARLCLGLVAPPAKQQMSTLNTKSVLWSIAGFWLGICRPWTLIPALTFLHTLTFSSVCAQFRPRALQSECTLHFSKLINYSPLHPPLCLHLFFLPLLRRHATFLQCIAFF